MDGHRIMNIEDAAPLGDFFVTATGNINVIPERALKEMKDQAVLANAGHFDVEIDLDALEKLSSNREGFRDNIERFSMKDGRDLYLLAQGRLVNLAAGDGHPAEIMDISFALQTLTAEHVLKAEGLEKKLYSVPEEVDERVAEMKLRSMDVEIDDLTPEQKEYLRKFN